MAPKARSAFAGGWSEAKAAAYVLLDAKVVHLPISVGSIADFVDN